jgi:hypothetical protein
MLVLAESMCSDLVSSRRLDSWKDIAAYLCRDVRTAIRWEKDKGLPVHRVPGGKRQAVFAYTTELDRWLTQEDEAASVPVSTAGETGASDGTGPQGLKPTSLLASVGTTEVEPFPDSTASETFFLTTPHARRVFRYLAIGAGLLVIAALGALLFAMRSERASINPPVRLGFTLKTMQAFDAEDRLLWTYSFPGILNINQLGPSHLMSDVSRIGDFRGDGGQEVLVAAPVCADLNAVATCRPEIDLVSREGKLLWSYVPHEILQFGKYQIQGPWALGSILVSPVGGKVEIWAAFLHTLWGNSYVVNLDPVTGKDALRYVNTGTLRALNEVRVGKKIFLLAGGFNNEPDLGSLAIIDENKSFASSPQTQGLRHQCMSCPPGESDYYFVFPRSELNEIKGLHEDSVTSIKVAGSQIEVIKGGADGSTEALVHYLLRADQDFRAAAVRFNSDYDMLHRKYEREGKLQHTLEQCPERLHPRPIKMWTPATGWREIQLDPTPFNQ